MAPNGGSWADYWASLAAAQDYYNSGGDPTSDVPADYQSRAQQGTVNDASTGFTPVTNPGYTQNNVGTGPNQGDPASPGYGQPIQTNYNPAYYANNATAQQIAQQLGGTVVQGDPFNLSSAGPFSAPNANMIQLPNGRVIDAGTIAGYEQVWGDNPSMLQALINSEITGQGQNPAAYTGSLANYNPAAVSQPGYKPPPGATVNTGGTTGGGTTGGTTGPGGTNTYGYAPPDMSQPTMTTGVRPSPRTAAPTDGSLTGPAGPAGNPPPGYQGGGFPSGGYPSVGTPTGMPYGTGAVGGYPIKVDAQGDPVDAQGNKLPPGAPPLPDWTYNPSNNVGNILANQMGYAVTQGGELMANYGSMLSQQQQRMAQLSSLGDTLYSNLQQNPGYTADQITGIMDQPGLNQLQWTDQMAQSNFLGTQPTVPQLDANGNPVMDAQGNPVMQSEQQAWMGNPYAAYQQYAQTATIPMFDANGKPIYQKDAQGNTVLDANGNPVQGKQTQADYLNQLARSYGGTISNIYDTGGTAIGDALKGMGTGLSNAINPAQLGLSSQFTTNYNWTPEDSQNIINAAGRNVGQQTAAIQDQMQRQAAASGQNAPLALSAALARQRQTGDVAASDAMTNAAIQAKQMGLNVQQTLEQMRLASAQDISSRQMQEATTMGQSDIAAQENLTAGRAAGALQTGLQQMNEQNTIAGQESQLTQQGEMAAQQRAQAMAQNRQQINQANQAAQFSRGSYIDQAASQRQTQLADAARADLTQARQDVRNEEQTAGNMGNSMMAGQLQTFGNVTGANQASQANAIRAAQLPTTLDKVIGVATGGGGGATQNAAEGEVVDKPSVRRIGERGPEIVIKLKHMGSGGPMTYRRRSEAAYA
jgi:hypothetical protein